MITPIVETVTLVAYAVRRSPRPAAAGRALGTGFGGADGADDDVNVVIDRTPPCE
jgi:hypothetical protein